MSLNINAVIIVIAALAVANILLSTISVLLVRNLFHKLRDEGHKTSQRLISRVCHYCKELKPKYITNKQGKTYCIDCGDRG